VLSICLFVGCPFTPRCAAFQKIVTIYFVVREDNIFDALHSRLKGHTPSGTVTPRAQAYGHTSISILGHLSPSPLFHKIGGVVYTLPIRKPMLKRAVLCVHPTKHTARASCALADFLATVEDYSPLVFFFHSSVLSKCLNQLMGTSVYRQVTFPLTG